MALAGRFHPPGHHPDSDTAVWVMIVVVFALSCFAFLSLLARVA